MRALRFSLALLCAAAPLASGEEVLRSGFYIDGEDREHWAFVPVQRAEPPAVENKSWPREDLDRFVLARLESEGLEPAPAAAPPVLLRRLSFALTGLPPTPEEVRKHLGSGEGEVDWVSVVDSLIASPAFGEHWARHWLDNVRYRPYAGRQASNDPYRLWVVRAFREDMPLREFVRMQIAGDLIPAGSPDEVHLDGMVAVRPFSLKNRHEHQIDLLGRTFLGLSLFCAQCHDHKHEPIAREDYYALKGLFESSQVIKAPYIKDRSDFDQYMAGLARKQGNETRMKKELKDYARVSQLMDLRERIANERKRMDDPKQKHKRAEIEKNIDKLSKDEEKRLADIEKREIALDAPEALEYIRLNKENRAFDSKWKEVYQFDAFVDQSDPEKIGDAEPPKEGVKVKPGDDPEREPPVPRRFPEILAGGDQEPLGERTAGSGRMELAEWLSDPAHPITTRLMVNRIWYHLLGEAIVPTLSNFGRSGQPPSHPELLDYLSAELVEGGGSMKELIRRIVLSATFSQSSQMDISDDERDRRSEVFGIGRSRRLDAESIWRVLHRAEQDPSSDQKPRPPSIELVSAAADLFDGADSSLIVPRRSASVSSLQALFFMNNEGVRASTERIAYRLSSLPDDEARIREAYLTFYGRGPGESELASAREFIDGWDPGDPPPNRKLPKDAPPHEVLGKWQAFIQALLASNEFLFVD